MLYEKAWQLHIKIVKQKLLSFGQLLKAYWIWNHTITFLIVDVLAFLPSAFLSNIANVNFGSYSYNTSGEELCGNCIIQKFHRYILREIWTWYEYWVHSKGYLLKRGAYLTWKVATWSRILLLSTKSKYGVCRIPRMNPGRPVVLNLWSLGGGTVSSQGVHEGYYLKLELNLWPHKVFKRNLWWRNGWVPLK